MRSDIFDHVIQHVHEPDKVPFARIAWQLEVAQDHFEYLYEGKAERKILLMARKTAEARAGQPQRFRINDAFHAYVDIRP